ncbi:MAG: hypothetical protein H0T84_09135 [Tatlockia sp.]|nr:hypothetical protein [Tatlockia sp.]
MIYLFIRTQDDFEQALLCIAKSKNLTYLELELEDNFNVSRKKLVQLATFLKQLKNLQILKLFGFTNIDFAWLGNFILNSSIEQLFVRTREDLDQNSAGLLTAFINNNSKMTFISMGPLKKLSDQGIRLNKLLVKDVSLIFKALENNKSLTHVDLSGNYFDTTEGTSDAIAKVLKNNTRLKSLNLAGISLFKPDAILAALAENKTLKSLDISSDKLYRRFNIFSDIEFCSLLTLLKKNISLTRLKILPQDITSTSHLRSLENYEDYLFGNSNQRVIYFCLEIEKILTRNIQLQTWRLYQGFIFLHHLLPKDVINLIFNLALSDFEMEELTRFSTTFANNSYHKPFPLQLNEKKEHKYIGNKVDNFKTIYKALYKGQSSLFKSWNSLVDKDELTEAEIDNYVKTNPNSRSAKAWQLAIRHESRLDKNKLFKQIHTYAYAHSSSFFGLFKQSRFSKTYFHLHSQISQAERGSRTCTIADLLISIK